MTVVATRSAAVPPTTESPRPADAPRVTKGRLEFLDALRGIAATAVAAQHGAEFVWPAYFRFSEETFRPGEFGVVLFFLCSGFIIPASLERYNSLRRFWLSRLFRLFPLYWFALAAALLMHKVLHRYYLDPTFLAHPVRGIAANLTMAQQFLNTPAALGNSWSLAYELAFYVFMSLLFLAGMHRRSVPLAVGGLCSTLAVGTLVPTLALSQHTRGSLLFVAGATLFTIAAFWYAVPAETKPRIAAVAMILGLIPLTLNRPDPMWFALLLFSTMFVGTVLYRATRGEVPWRTAWAVYGGALATLIVALYANVVPSTVPGVDAQVTWRSEVPTFAGAYLVFGAALLLRRRRFPRWLVYLGTISYSLYLVHPLVYYSVPWWGSNTTLTFVRWFGLAVVLSMLTYRFVEKPFIDIGHRFAAHGVALRARNMPDQAAP